MPYPTRSPSHVIRLRFSSLQFKRVIKCYKSELGAGIRFQLVFYLFDETYLDQSLLTRKQFLFKFFTTFNKAMYMLSTSVHRQELILQKRKFHYIKFTLIVLASSMYFTESFMELGTAD
jgi:hypothetical protein